MARVSNPELKKYMDKRVLVQLNGSRKIKGLVRGYDMFLNIVIDEAVEVKNENEPVQIGITVIRGNSVVSIEALEPIS